MWSMRTPGALVPIRGAPWERAMQLLVLVVLVVQLGAVYPAMKRGTKYEGCDKRSYKRSYYCPWYTPEDPISF